MTPPSGLSFVQKIARAFTSAGTFAAMEAESRLWMCQCPGCGAERSIWDMGGIRSGAAGQPRRAMRCFSCGKIGAHKVYRSGAGPGGPLSDGEVAGLVAAIVLGAIVLAGLTVLAVLWLTGAF